MTHRTGYGQSKGSGTANRGVVVVDRIGQELLVEPRCDEVLSTLRTARHALVRDKSGVCRVEAVPESLGAVDDHPSGTRTYYPAGLEPVIGYLLEKKGYRTERTGDRSVLLADPEPRDGRGLATMDAAMIDFVFRHERGLIRHDGRVVNPAWLVAQLRLAFPAARIAVAVGRREDLWAFGGCLKSIIPGATVADDSCPDPAGPMVVTTFSGLGADGVHLEKLDIVVVPDAVEALGQDARRALPGVPQARLYGLLDRSRRLAPYDRDRVQALFGPDEVVIPRHGHVERPVEVVTFRITGGPAVSPGSDLATLKRQACWLNPARNRRIARLAGALALAERRRIAAEFPAIAARLEGDAGPRIVVLVENVEHALVLAGCLPGWPIVVGDPVTTAGLPTRRADALDRRRWQGDGLPPVAIATLAGLDAAGPVEADVVIRADCGEGIPGAMAGVTLTRNHPAPPLLLIDVDDRHHPPLRRRGRRRRAGYLAAGWSLDSRSARATPIERFLAARPRGK